MRFYKPISNLIFNWPWSGTAMSTDRLFLCETEHVPILGVIQIEVSDLLLAVYNLDGDFFVTDDRCTHGPGILSDGCIEDGKIECDFHGGEFDIRTGAVVTAPCMIPIKTYTAIIENDKIYIDRI
jgi:nitrite reductase/ring-hydroxylating ferredoxin subunit